MTAIEWLVEQLPIRIVNSFQEEIAKAKQMERQQISDAMMYALDEDGHTGDWRIKFINDYYESNFGVRPE